MTVDEHRRLARLRQPRATIAVRHSLVAVHTLLAVDDGTFVSLARSARRRPRRRRGLRQRRARSPCSSARTSDRRCSRRRSSSTTTRRWRPRARATLFDATEIDEILALRVLTLTDEEKAEARGTDPRAAAIIDRSTTCRPKCGPGCTAPCAIAAPPTRRRDRGEDEAPLPWWDPAIDGAVDPWTDTVVVGGVEVRHGHHVCACARRAAPMPTTCSSPASTPRWPASSATSTASCTSRSPSTTTRRPRRSLAQGRYLFFHPDEIEPLRDAEPAT